jgi:3-deoxy-7-phosphoheptulonate synthase
MRLAGSVVRIRDFAVGSGNFAIIAGPCTVETEKQVLTTAKLVKAAGATALRGGAFKPRTSPYTFQGLKLEGLKILHKVRKETGLVTVTEAMSPEEIKLVAEYADIVQIGSRNAQNYRLLEACGEVRIPVVLKRGFANTLEEFLMSAEYILAGGNEQVILCERGIKTFETHVRYTLAVGTIPALKSMTHLPVIVDPSHAAGDASLVPSLAFASTAAGADGLLIEVHPDPEHALCDGRQSLTPEEFTAMAHTCKKIRKVI